MCVCECVCLCVCLYMSFDRASPALKFIVLKWCLLSGLLMPCNYLCGVLGFLSGDSEQVTLVLGQHLPHPGVSVVTSSHSGSRRSGKTQRTREMACSSSGTFSQSLDLIHVCFWTLLTEKER